MAVLSDAKFIKHEKNLWHEVGISICPRTRYNSTNKVLSYYSHVTSALTVRFVPVLSCSLLPNDRSLISFISICFRLHLDRIPLNRPLSSILPLDLPAKIVSTRSPTNPLESYLLLTFRKRNGLNHLSKRLHLRTNGEDLLCRELRTSGARMLPGLGTEMLLRGTIKASKGRPGESSSKERTVRWSSPTRN